jgi:hypothetical protein
MNFSGDWTKRSFLLAIICVEQVGVWAAVRDLIQAALGLESEGK